MNKREKGALRTFESEIAQRREWEFHCDSARYKEVWRSGVTISDSCHGIWFRGTREALLASGIGQVEWFPVGDLNSFGKAVRTRRLSLLSGLLVDVRMEGRTPNGRYFVGVDVDGNQRTCHAQKEAAAAYRAAERAARFDKEFRAWLRSLKTRIACLPLPTESPT